MKCNNCGVSIIDLTDRCPLCQNVLEGEVGGKITYPNIIKSAKAMSFVIRLLLFISILASAVCVTVNVAFTPNLYWSVTVVASLAYMMWAVYISTKENAGYRFRTLSLVLGGVLLVTIIDYISGFRGWSINYALPGAIIFIDLALLLVMIINRRNWQSYIIFQLAMIFVGVLPLVLTFRGVITDHIVSDIAFGITVVIFIGSIILGGRRARTEMQRRFHI